MIKRVLPYAAYPLMTSTALVASVWAVGRGWPVWLIGVVAVVVATGLVELLERLIPYSQKWRVPHDDRLTDFFHLLFSNRAFDIGTLAAIALCAPASAWLSETTGTSLWPHHWPLLLQTLLAVLLFELPWYWVHRLCHSSPLLWRVHAVHHSSRRIYWWNFSRNHPLDNLVSGAVAIAPLMLLGIGEAPLAVMAAFSAAHGMMQHSNIDLRTGFLDFFLSTARVHRWHHSPNRREADANYSPRLMLWDHLFGSYRFNPHVLPPEDIGLGDRDADFPTGFWSQMAIPFRSEFWR